MSGSISADLFGSVGQRASQNLQSALAQVGRGIEPDQSVLDFGSGGGRTLLWLIPDFPKTRFYGTDVDPEAVEWCRCNLTNAQFQVNSPLPPMLYHDEQFDVVYLISVFTHLSDEYQEVWLPELRRVTRRGGILLLTVHGEEVWKRLHPAKQNE